MDALADSLLIAVLSHFSLNLSSHSKCLPLFLPDNAATRLNENK